MSNPNYNPDLPDGPHNDPGSAATPQEACREYASNFGAEHPDRAWILTDFDTWEHNPFYTGPAVPHPEYDEADWHSDDGLVENDGEVEIHHKADDEIPF